MAKKKNNKSNGNTPSSPHPSVTPVVNIPKDVKSRNEANIQTTPVVGESGIHVPQPTTTKIETKPPVIAVPFEDTAKDSKNVANHTIMPTQELKTTSEHRNGGNLMMVWVMIGLLMIGWVVSCGWMSIQIMELRNQISHAHSMIQSAQEMKFSHVLNAVEHATKSFDQKLVLSEKRIVSAIEKIREENIRAKPVVERKVRRKQHEPIVERKIKESAIPTVPEPPIQHKPEIKPIIKEHEPKITKKPEMRKPPTNPSKTRPIFIDGDLSTPLKQSLIHIINKVVQKRNLPQVTWSQTEEGSCKIQYKEVQSDRFEEYAKEYVHIMENKFYKDYVTRLVLFGVKTRNLEDHVYEGHVGMGVSVTHLELVDEGELRDYKGNNFEKQLEKFFNEC